MVNGVEVVPKSCAKKDEEPGREMRRQPRRDRGRSVPRRRAGGRVRGEEAGEREDEKRRLKEEAEERSLSEATRLASSVAVMRQRTPSASGKANGMEGDEDVVTTEGPSLRL